MHRDENTVLRLYCIYLNGSKDNLKRGLGLSLNPCCVLYASLSFDVFSLANSLMKSSNIALLRSCTILDGYHLLDWPVHV